MTVSTTTNISELVSEAFASDPVLIDKWHISSGKGLQACIDKTVEDLKKADHSFSFYSVHQDSQFIGYFGTEANGAYLTTIFIKPEFRKSHRKLVWNAIREKTRAIFCTAIYSKNTPCIKFYQKHGKIISQMKYDNQDVTVFEFRS